MISPSDSDSGELKTARRPGSVGRTAARDTGWRFWLSTTTGIVLMLLLVQLVTGLLLAFYYVPSADHAHTTVSFIEKVLPSGTWLRALHHHGSQWLPLFLFLHLLELFRRQAYRTNAARWLGTVLLLALVMAAGATGYSLPWDLRAFFSTRVAEGIVSGLPLIGGTARIWLLGSSEVSTQTVSRFFALHVLVTPFLILLVVGWQFFVRQAKQFSSAAADRSESNDENLDLLTSSPAKAADPVRRISRSGGFLIDQLTRNVLVSVIVFLLLAIYAYKVPAPLGPSASNIAANYLPRPGAQFVWLYQSLKYVPGALGSLVGVVLPGLVFLVLGVLPWLNRTPFNRITHRPRRNIGALILASSIVFVASMTFISYVSDRRDPRTRQQLARQAAEEAAFRREPFVAALLKEDDTANAAAGAASPAPNITAGGPPRVVYEALRDLSWRTR